MRRYRRPATALALLGLLSLATPVVRSEEAVAPAVVALSADDGVFLIQPGAAPVKKVETGQVGFLYPAPGGMLFAPDLVNGRTTILDFLLARVVDRFVGVTIPRFGPWRDRYLVVAGGLTVLSYPERSLIWKMDGGFERPWQVEIDPKGTSFLILERGPAEGGEAILSAVDMMAARIIRRRVFPTGLARFAIVPEVGLLAAADTAGRRVRLLDPHTFADVRSLPINGSPVDVAVGNRGRDLLAVGAEGRIHRWRFKSRRADFSVTRLDEVPIEGRGLLMRVAPDGESVAVATDLGHLYLVLAKKGKVVGIWEVPSRPRDLVWCDSGQSSPLLPNWSDLSGEIEAPNE